MSFPRHQFAIEAHKSSITQITCYSPELQTKSTQHYHLALQSATELKPPSLAVHKTTLRRIRHTDGFNTDLRELTAPPANFTLAQLYHILPIFHHVHRQGTDGTNTLALTAGWLMLNSCILQEKPTPNAWMLKPVYHL